MSTRGNICVKVKSQDFERVNKLVGGISEETPYMYIYNHFDSYPDGLGKQLVENYNDYDKALDLVLEGDCSAPEQPYSKREGYENTKPRTAHVITEANQQEYLYVYENDGWNCYDEKMTKLPIN